MSDTDYVHPDWWHDEDTTDEDREEWYRNERNRRQVMRQLAAGAMPRTEQMVRSMDRRGGARSETVDLEEMR
jgi:hypothetical protein